MRRNGSLVDPSGEPLSHRQNKIVDLAGQPVSSVEKKETAFDIKGFVVAAACSDGNLRQVTLQPGQARKLARFLSHLQGGQLQLLGGPLFVLARAQKDQFVVASPSLLQAAAQDVEPPKDEKESLGPEDAQPENSSGPSTSSG